MFVAFRTIQRRCAAPQSLRVRLHSQSGFTLIETIMAAALSTIVVGSAMSALEVSQRTQSRDTEWAQVIQEGRTGLARMVREIRQAYSIRRTSETSIDFYATFGGVDYEIEYACNVKEPDHESYYECVRVSANVGQTLPTPSASTGQAIIKYVLNGTTADASDPIFKEFSPNAIAPDLVTIKLVLPSAGTLKLAGAKTLTHQVILTNNAYIRDMNLES